MGTNVAMCVPIFLSFLTRLFYVSSWKMNNNFQVVSLTIFVFLRAISHRWSAVKFSPSSYYSLSLAWGARRSREAPSSFCAHHQTVGSIFPPRFFSFSLFLRLFVRTNYQQFVFAFSSSSSSSLFWRFRQREKCDARLDITSHPPDPNFPRHFFFLFLFRSFFFSSPIAVSHPLVKCCFIISLPSCKKISGRTL